MNIQGVGGIRRGEIATSIAELAAAKDKAGLDNLYNMQFFSLVGLGKNGILDLVNSPFILLGRKGDKEAMQFLLDYCLNNTQVTDTSKKCYITQMVVGYAEGELVDDVLTMIAEYPEYPEIPSYVALAFARSGNAKAYEKLLESKELDYEMIGEDEMWSIFSKAILETAYSIILAHITDIEKRTQIATMIAKAMLIDDCGESILSDTDELIEFLNPEHDVASKVNKIMARVNVQLCMQQLNLSYQDAVAFTAVWRKPELHLFILAGHQLRENYGPIPIEIMITICSYIGNISYPVAKKLFDEFQKRIPCKLFDVSKKEIDKRYHNMNEKDTLKNLRDNGGYPQTKEQALMDTEAIFKKRRL